MKRNPIPLGFDGTLSTFCPLDPQSFWKSNRSMRTTPGLCRFLTVSDTLRRSLLLSPALSSSLPPSAGLCHLRQSLQGRMWTESTNKTPRVAEAIVKPPTAARRPMTRVHVIAASTFSRHADATPPQTQPSPPPPQPQPPQAYASGRQLARPGSPLMAPINRRRGGQSRRQRSRPTLTAHAEPSGDDGGGGDWCMVVRRGDGLRGEAESDGKGA